MGVLKSGEKLIAMEEDYTSGNVNDAYDIYLAEETSTKNLFLILFMKIQFFFEDSKDLKWTSSEKKAFTIKFETAINQRWGNKRLLKTLPSGKKVYIDFRFESLIEGWSITEHWEINVKKISVGAFSQSFVQQFTGKVSLDTEDFTFVKKKGGGTQRGVVHEFGHMLGLDDEYEVGANIKDYNSIMNGGEIIRERHDSVYVKWLDNILTKKNIK